MYTIEKMNNLKTHRSVLILFLLFAASNCFSQNDNENLTSQFRKRFISNVSFEIGPSLCFIYGGAEEDEYTVDSKDVSKGYSFGIGATHALTDRFDIRMSLLFERKGGIINHEGTYFDNETQTLKEGTVSDEYKYDCYTVPVIASYRAGIFRFGVGPYASFLQKQIKVATYSFSASNVTDETHLNNKFDFGMSFIVSCDISLNSRFSISPTIQNNLGLIHTRNISYENDRTLKLNNTVLLIGIIYKR